MADFDPLSDPLLAGQAAPDDLIQAMRRMGLIGQLSGDKVIAPMGQGLEQQAGQMVNQQRLAAQTEALNRHRMAMESLRQQQIDKPTGPQGPRWHLNPQTGDYYDANSPAPVPSDPGAPPTTPAGPLRVPAGPVVQRPGKAPKPSLGGLLTGSADSDQTKLIADAIENGHQPPDMKALYKYGAPVKAELERRGFDVASATVEWDATKRHLSTMNGQQQERLRQAINFTSHSLDKIDELYNQWQKVGPASGFRVFNRAALASAKQVGGEPGAVAQALEAQINDLTAEMANVYMGGNSPTDHALTLAKENLSADWNDKTFKMAIDQARRNLKLRANAMVSAPVAGLPNGSRYMPPAAEPAPAAPAAAPVRKFTRGADGKLTEVKP